MATTSTKASLAFLLLSLLVIGVASRHFTSTDSEDALEHQRILAELEEVHKLRESMLQQAATYITTSGAPAPAPGGTHGNSLTPASIGDR